MQISSGCHNRYCGAALATWLLLTPSQALANDAAGVLDEGDLLTSVPLISTAARMDQTRAEAGVAMTLIDRTMIEASGAQEIADLFRLVPGLQAFHVNGNKFGVAAHGMGNPFPGRFEVLMDGRSVYMLGFSSPDWRALGIGLSDIERIEVVRAPSASSWGANAFQGTINLITRAPTGLTRATLDAAAGDPGSRRIEASAETLLGESLLRGGMGYRRQDGFSDNDQGSAGYANLRSISTPTLADRIEVQLGFSDGYGGVGEESVASVARRDFRSHFQSLTWTRSLSSGNELQLRAYHNYLDYRMERRLMSELFGQQFGLTVADLSALGIPDEPIPAYFEEVTTHRYDLELQHQIETGSGWRILWGLGARQEDGYSPLLLNRSDTLTENFWRLFANSEWKPAAGWTLNAGALLDHNSIAGTHTSPRLTLSHQLAPGHTLRGGYSLTYHTPSLLEAHQDTRLMHSNGSLILWAKNTDPDIESEENRTLEIGYLAEFPRQRSELDLRLYREDIRNGIGRQRNSFSEPQALPPQLRTTNTNNANWVGQGLEAELRFQPSHRSLIALNYSYLDIDGAMNGGDRDAPDADYLNLDLFGPRHTASLLASHRFARGYQLSGVAYHQSESHWISGSALPGYTRLDLRLARQFDLGGQAATLALVVQNLGSSYREYQQRNLFDTRTLLTFNLTLD
ncbi:TonB-dependent receptor plug domain-containing protein [Motiliproteus sediminis]|uniref:TonB-dependent receptor plug domain-containing protein n=1 Tax=Motiliproteus sediminis TaxID=1468178 RepID=UPI001AEF4D33|nr:TonB-dependent receptor [Motiliproteus sediminis]